MHGTAKHFRVEYGSGGDGDLPAASPAERRDTQPGWPAALVTVAAALAGLIGLFWETAASAVMVWEASASFNHCFLILPISGYLIWRRRDHAARLAPRPSAWGIVLLAAMGLLWLIGNLAAFKEAQHFALVGMIQGVLLAVLGGAVYRALAFPFLYLFFMVPTGEFLVPPLQDFTAGFTVMGLRLLGIPVFLDGVFIQIPNGLFEVAEACAGLRFLIATLAFGALFAHLVYRSWTRRLLFFAASVVVPIIANGIRAFGIVMIAHLSDNTLAVGVDHLVYGWGFFAAITMALIWVGLKFQEPEDDGADAAAAAPVAAAAAAPVALVAAGLAALVIAAVPRAYASHIAEAQPTVDAAALAAPPAPPGWAAADADGWRPVLPGHDHETRAAYAGADATVQYYLGYFARQDHGRKIISSQNRMVDDETWRRLGGGSAEAVLDGRPLKVRVERISDGRVNRLVWYWFWVDSRFVDNAPAAKLLQVKAELLGGNLGAALVAVAADYRHDPREAAETLRAFLASMPPLAPRLARAAAGG